MTITQTIGGVASAGFWSPQIISAIISAGVSIITLIVVGTIAFRQWQTAKDKLALDLFVRRLEAYQHIRIAINNRLDETRAAIDKGEQMGRTESLKYLWETFEDAEFLFGNDVRVALRELETRVYAFAFVGKDDRVDPDDPTSMMSVHFHNGHIHSAREAFTAAVEPYMMMGHIAVNRPSKLFRWPWKRKP